MTNFKKILFFIFAIAFISQVNAEKYKIQNNSDKELGILCFYNNEYYIGGSIEPNTDATIEAEAFQYIRIFKSLEDVNKYVENIKNKLEQSLETIQNILFLYNQKENEWVVYYDGFNFIFKSETDYWDFKYSNFLIKHNEPYLFATIQYPNRLTVKSIQPNQIFKLDNDPLVKNITISNIIGLLEKREVVLSPRKLEINMGEYSFAIEKIA